MKTIVLCLLLALAGCADNPAYFAAKATAMKEAAAVADETLDASQYMLCSGISVGAWRREYGTSEERAKAWRTLCSPKVEASP
jgi:hypothetical protein